MSHCYQILLGQNFPHSFPLQKISKLELRTAFLYCLKLLKTNRIWGSVLPTGQERLFGDEKEGEEERKGRGLYVQGSLYFRQRRVRKKQILHAKGR